MLSSYFKEYADYEPYLLESHLMPHTKPSITTEQTPPSLFRHNPSQLPSQIKSYSRSSTAFDVAYSNSQFPYSPTKHKHEMLPLSTGNDQRSVKWAVNHLTLRPSSHLTPTTQTRSPLTNTIRIDTSKSYLFIGLCAEPCLVFDRRLGWVWERVTVTISNIYSLVLLGFKEAEWLEFVKSIFHGYFRPPLNTMFILAGFRAISLLTSLRNGPPPPLYVEADNAPLDTQAPTVVLLATTLNIGACPSIDVDLCSLPVDWGLLVKLGRLKECLFRHAAYSTANIRNSFPGAAFPHVHLEFHYCSFSCVCNTCVSLPALTGPRRILTFL
eukprot:gene2327-4527_t